MTRLVLYIYEFFRQHRVTGWLLFGGVTCYLVVSMLSLDYKEDIRDFLPLDDESAVAMEIYQDITGANRIYGVVEGECRDSVIAGVETLLDCIARRDTLGFVARTVATVDDDAVTAVTEAVYRLMPVLLDDDDYRHIDSVIQTPDVANNRLAFIKQLLQLPTASPVVDNLRHDPLGLFGGVMSRLGSGVDSGMVDTSDGYMMTADGKSAFVMLESSFGANESSLNGMLSDMLDEAALEVAASCPGLSISFTGGPVIAVDNARCIRHDSILGVVVASLVIIALLVYVFRSGRNIALIFVSVGWGWLFAMGCIALYYDTVSIIVIGIASVMLGIAVNYPLHLVGHLDDVTDRRKALSQIVAPLVVGNVTTVGAFMCLVPLDSRALHDLGLFSALLLVGTILFVLVFLPHAVKRVPATAADTRYGWIDRLASCRPSGNRRVLLVVGVITLVLGFFATRTTFDSDLRGINYLTDGRKALFDRLSAVSGTGNSDGRIYVASTGDTWDDAVQQYERARHAVTASCAYGSVDEVSAPGSMLVSRETQLRRLGKWSLLASRRDSLSLLLGEAARRNGFSASAFGEFENMLDRSYETVGEEGFEPLAASVFMRSVSRAGDRYAVVDILDIKDGADKDAAIEDLRAVVPAGTIVFDVTGMNSAMTGTLADSFNYIGIACGCIVFLFLWLSMGRLELAVVSFLPMAVGWVWILGIMGLFDIHFNIVNVILATFIFGQGDDYTIFITEGLLYEYRTGRQIVTRFKSSIIVSALIMFAGIGVLVFAEHPAMRSLGQVAVIGMITVVVMAYVITPVAFDLLVKRRFNKKNE